MNFFDYVNNINNKFNKNLEIDKNFSSYLCCLHYSHKNENIFWINNINKFIFNIPDKIVYKYFFEKITKGKNWIKWIKKDKQLSENIEYLMNKYNISKREAQESLLKKEI